MNTPKLWQLSFPDEILHVDTWPVDMVHAGTSHYTYRTSETPPVHIIKYYHHFERETFHKVTLGPVASLLDSISGLSLPLLCASTSDGLVLKANRGESSLSHLQSRFNSGYHLSPERAVHVPALEQCSTSVQRHWQQAFLYELLCDRGDGRLNAPPSTESWPITTWAAWDWHKNKYVYI